MFSIHNLPICNIKFKAVKINEELTRLAVSKGLIKEPKKKSWYEREIGPMFHKKYESSESSSEEEGAKSGNQKQGIRRQENKKLLKNDKKDKETRDKEKNARSLDKKVQADKIQAEKDEMDAKIFAKLNRQHG